MFQYQGGSLSTPHQAKLKKTKETAPRESRGSRSRPSPLSLSVPEVTQAAGLGTSTTQLLGLGRSPCSSEVCGAQSLTPMLLLKLLEASRGRQVDGEGICDAT